MVLEEVKDKIVPSKKNWKHELLVIVIAWIGHLFLSLLYATFRKKIINQKHLEEAEKLSSSGCYLLAMWHHHILTMTICYRSIPLMVMSSQSKDGDYISGVLHKFGWKTARGSSSKRGKEALEEMIARLSDKNQDISGILTIDGPRGPLYKVKRGIIEIARRAQVPIVPYAPINDRYWEANSWDKFRIPKPFSRFVCAYGRPIVVKEKINEDEMVELREEVKNSLFELEKTTRENYFS